jgi:hypothetical protein
LRYGSRNSKSRDHTLFQLDDNLGYAVSGVSHSNPIQSATVVTTAPTRYSALVNCDLLQLKKNWRAPKPRATFVHKSQIQLLGYLLIFQVGRRWWRVCSQLRQVSKRKNQNGTAELGSSSLPWRVKPHSLASTCVDELSCHICYGRFNPEEAALPR